MARIIVSILSNHSVPNFLFIKEMEGQYDRHLFVTSPEIGQLGRKGQLIKALGITQQDVTIISVDGNDYLSAIATLTDKWQEDEDNDYIVNLTGGTKMMSLAVHDFFKDKRAEFYYVPLGKNEYYNLGTGEKTPLKYRVNLREYFSLYGIRFESKAEDTFVHPESETMGIFESVQKSHFYLPKKLRDAQKAATPELRRYLGGEWFEEFSFFKLKEAFNLRDEDIAVSLKIYRENESTKNDNELDVAFMFNNVLYVVECKVTMTGYGRDTKLVVDDYLYKLAAISKDFGLQVSAYIFTLHRMQTFSDEVKLNFLNRCRILGIKGIVTGKMFSNIKASLFNKQALSKL